MDVSGVGVASQGRVLVFHRAGGHFDRETTAVIAMVIPHSSSGSVLHWRTHFVCFGNEEPGYLGTAARASRYLCSALISSSVKWLSRFRATVLISFSSRSPRALPVRIR